jgi:hypothetical protein
MGMYVQKKAYIKEKKGKQSSSYTYIHGYVISTLTGDKST